MSNTRECAAQGAVQGPRGDHTEVISTRSSTVYGSSLRRGNMQRGRVTRKSRGACLVGNDVVLPGHRSDAWLRKQRNGYSRVGKATERDVRYVTPIGVLPMCRGGRMDAAYSQLCCCPGRPREWGGGNRHGGLSDMEVTKPSSVSERASAYSDRLWRICTRNRC